MFQQFGMKNVNANGELPSLSRSPIDSETATKRKVVQIRKFNNQTGHVSAEAPVPENQYFQWITKIQENQKEDAIQTKNINSSINESNNSKQKNIFDKDNQKQQDGHAVQPLFNANENKKNPLEVFDQSKNMPFQAVSSANNLFQNPSQQSIISNSNNKSIFNQESEQKSEQISQNKIFGQSEKSLFPVNEQQNNLFQNNSAFSKNQSSEQKNNFFNNQNQKSSLPPFSESKQFQNEAPKNNQSENTSLGKQSLFSNFGQQNTTVQTGFQFGLQSQSNQPQPSSLFGQFKQNQAFQFGNNQPGLSIFNNNQTLFGNPSANMFINQSGQSKQFETNDDDDDDGAYKNEEDEAPTVTLQDSVIDKSTNPFDKVFDKLVDKFKYIIPANSQPAENKDATREVKKSCGNGKISIEIGEIGKEQKVKMQKIVFRNNIGKTLYEANIVKNSKIRKIPEKSNKNQIKISVLQYNMAIKKAQMQFCLINFQRDDEMNNFEKKFKEQVDSLQK